MSQFETIIYEVSEQIATITLNRPEVRNSLNQKMRFELRDALGCASADPAVRVVILAAAGKGFCAGADLAEKFDGSDADGFVTRQVKNEYNPIVQAIIDCQKPVISAVNGAAAGIGSSIAMACDLTVMADDAFLYSAFGAISLIPDGGNHFLLNSALGYKRAYEMIIESKRLTAQQCLEFGMTNRVVPAAELLTEARTWALSLKDKAPLTMMLSKKILRNLPAMGVEQSMAMEAELQNVGFMSEDFKEGTTAFFEKRAPKFQGK